jgi:hypothetical protein
MDTYRFLDRGMMAVALGLAGVSFWTGAEKPAGAPSPVYDPARELRISVAEKPVRLEGPWRFGALQLEEAEAELGPASRRGAGYLEYDYDERRVRLTLLFGGGRLDTMVVEPLGDGRVRLAEPLPDTPSPVYETDQALYVQRLTREVRTPPAVRGVPIAGPSGPAPARLLAHFRQALELKERALGATHTAVEFLRFELGRLQAGAEGRRLMQAALASLAPRLGADHPDVVAMETWLRKETGRNAT